MTDTESRPGEMQDRRDSAPGEERITEHEVAGGLLGYVIGYGLAILLTIASFLAAQTDLIYQPAVISALVVLAVAQMGV
ncbi:cytochrome o ubiquinol oxidase subunit IV, partial [Mesorhizobium sp. M7A.F.Ca.US.001.02.1.1]